MWGLRSRLRSVLGQAAPSPSPAKPRSIWDGYSSDALQLAEIIDAGQNQIGQRQQYPERVRVNRAERVCNWYVPAFDNPFYGGVMTIIRFAAHMRLQTGIRQRFIVCGAASTEEMRARVQLAIPAFDDFEVYILDGEAAIHNIPAADYGIATLWTTAYVLLGVQNCGLKFYFVQDFEPLFYPAGSTYGQALATYYFGFIILANTRGVLASLPAEAVPSKAFTPQIDTSVFHETEAQTRSPEVRRLFCYARPGHPRNGFELAVAALKRVKDRMGQSVEIVCAGADWVPSDYGLDGKVTAVGMLPFAETGHLYRSCHAGLAMMYTRHPSYLPFELMACGATVVANRNPANEWFLRDGVNCRLAHSTASSVADTIEAALVSWEDDARLRAAARQDIATLAGRGWPAEFDDLLSFMETLHQTLAPEDIKSHA